MIFDEQANDRWKMYEGNPREEVVKTYKVHITQYCKPIVVRARDEDEARQKVSEDYEWEVEVVDFDIEPKGEM
jgi:hypothetical protein